MKASITGLVLESGAGSYPNGLIFVFQEDGWIFVDPIIYDAVLGPDPTWSY